MHRINALCGPGHSREGVLLFVTGVTCWEIFLLRSEIDGGTRKSCDTIDMLQVRYRLAVTEGARCLHLFDRIRQFKETARALKEVCAEIGAQSVADNWDIQID